jgi:DNA-binding MarR family transcriptional regulator
MVAMGESEPRQAAPARPASEAARDDFPGADGLALATLLLSAAAALVEGIHERVQAAGFGDLRPAHGFAFARISAGDATVGDVAEHLGVTKQAASQLVDELERKGYVTRARHPADARAWLLALTPRGWACTRAADRATAQITQGWAAVLGPDRFAALRADLARVAPVGPLRPAAW